METDIYIGEEKEAQEMDLFHSKANMDVLKQAIKAANTGKLTDHELIEE